MMKKIQNNMHDINKLIYPLLKRKIIPGQPLVLVEEEYGYKYWFWFPRKSKSEVIKWWKRQPYQGLKRFIPLTDIGELVLASRNRGLNNLIPLNEVYAPSEYYDSLNAWRDPISDLWDRLHTTYKHPNIMYAHLFYDSDSYLVDGSRFITHAGYNQAKLEEEENIIEHIVSTNTFKFYEET